MADVVVSFPMEQHTARVRYVARWLSGHAGRTRNTFCRNFNMEVRRYAAGLIVAGVPSCVAWQHAEQFQGDVATRLAEIRRANAERPAADVVLLPVLPIAAQRGAA
jgi:hypothetical protein